MERHAAGEAGDDDLYMLLEEVHEARVKSLELHGILEALKPAWPKAVVKAVLKEIAAEAAESAPARADAADAVVAALVARVGLDRVMYRAGAWFMHEGSAWKKRTDEQMRGLILDEVRRINPDARAAQVIRDAELILSVEAGRHHDIDVLMRLPRPLINCTNATVELVDGGVQLREHDPFDYIFATTSCPYLPQAKCPEFDRTLAEILAPFGDEAPAMEAYLYESWGYWMMPRKRHKAFWIFHGPGDNAKSSLVNLITGILGPGQVSSVSIATLSQRFGLSAVVGKLLIIEDDMSIVELPDGEIKKVAQQSLLTIEEKGKGFYEVINTATPVLITNNLPTTADISPAIYSRAHVVYLPRVFHESDPKTDKDLFPRIQANEAEGILARCVEGALRLERRGRFDLPPSVQRARDAWAAQSNPVRLFMTHCVVRDDADRRLTARDLYPVFTRWYEEHERVVGRPPSRTQLGRQIHSMGGWGYRTASMRDGGWYLQGFWLSQDVLGDPQFGFLNHLGR